MRSLVAEPTPGPLLEGVGSRPSPTLTVEVNLRVRNPNPALGQRPPVLRASAGRAAVYFLDLSLLVVAQGRPGGSSARVAARHDPGGAPAL